MTSPSRPRFSWRALTTFFVENPAETVGAVAARAGLTPQQLYASLSVAPAPPILTEGGGYGRKDVAGLCEQFSMPHDLALARLRDRGISATPTTSVRDIVDAHGLTPLDVACILVAQQP
jgi:hypothetical protein